MKKDCLINSFESNNNNNKNSHPFLSWQSIPHRTISISAKNIIRGHRYGRTSFPYFLCIMLKGHTWLTALIRLTMSIVETEGKSIWKITKQSLVVVWWQHPQNERLCKQGGGHEDTGFLGERELWKLKDSKGKVTDCSFLLCQPHWVGIACEAALSLSA